MTLACDRERAYVRDWRGEVRAFDGQRWASLPRIPARGSLLWASPSGRVVGDSEQGVWAWEGTSWAEIAVDPWFAGQERGGQALFAIDGLGQSPWSPAVAHLRTRGLA